MLIGVADIINFSVINQNMKKFNSVVLIDDDEINNYIISRLFKRLNLSEQVTIFRNGREGLNFIQSLSNQSEFPEVIFLDIKMPIMTGVEFLEALKKLSLNFSNVKIIVISNSIHPDEFSQLKPLGVCEVLMKPITEEKLLICLNSKAAL